MRVFIVALAFFIFAVSSTCAGSWLDFLHDNHEVIAAQEEIEMPDMDLDSGLDDQKGSEARSYYSHRNDAVQSYGSSSPSKGFFSFQAILACLPMSIIAFALPFELGLASSTVTSTLVVTPA